MFFLALSECIFSPVTVGKSGYAFLENLKTNPWIFAFETAETIKLSLFLTKMYFMLSISKPFKLSRLERMQCHMSGFCIYSYTTYIYIYNYIYTVLRRLLHLLQPWYCRLGFLCWDCSDFLLGQLLLCSVDTILQILKLKINKRKLPRRYT